MDATGKPNWTRRLALAGNVLLVAGVLVVTSPWTSGIYTWFAQQRLRAQFAPAAAPAPRPTKATQPAAQKRDPVWEGWERDDARAWRAAKEGDALGRLRIPRLGLDSVVVAGTADRDLRLGPGWVRKSAPPGPRGNCGISGHRTTYLAPFREIDRMRPGDAITIETRWRTYTYRVTGRSFAEAHDGDVVDQDADEAPTLTLTSCHPPYSAQFRIVVRAALAQVKRR